MTNKESYINNLILIAGFIVSVTAVIYAGLAYHYLRRPSARKISNYSGELPKDAKSLFNFLLENENKIIHLDIQVSLTRDAASPNQRTWVISHGGLDGASKTDALEIQHEMEGSVFNAKFVIIGCAPKISYINARTVDLFPKKDFILKIEVVADAARFRGSLIQVDPIQLANYITS